MDDISIGFIGFGLIGGSIAKAIKETHPNARILAYNYHQNTNTSLELALSEHVIDEIVTELKPSFHDLDLIFLCAPVLTNIEYLKQLKEIINDSCIITDVGSVKGEIHNAVSALQLDHNFIGGHPMTGSEKTGYENSSAVFLENAFYILTPTALTKNKQYQFLEALVRDMKAIPICLDSTTHDDATAAISHVPHIIAYSLVKMVEQEDNPEHIMKTIAAGGFKDITRIVSSSPVMWQSICLTNKESILKFLHRFQDTLSESIQMIEQQDSEKLYTMFENGKEYRDSLSDSSNGALHKVYEVYVDIIDEAGAIATIATLLAINGISIKNIGILHNREFSQGVLRIELYDEKGAGKTVELLKHYHYTIYKR
ncbi:prephenate dehydrogenase [Lachnospiraceae bacterium KM106-2]|nr:prephenate dehydrogenase [Lachnospiraceae bacterium KM106-2]